ncbi:hypothetical protein EniLVp02_0036 [Vibrio phage EniLVp02]
MKLYIVRPREIIEKVPVPLCNGRSVEITVENRIFVGKIWRVPAVHHLFAETGILLHANRYPVVYYTNARGDFHVIEGGHTHKAQKVWAFSTSNSDAQIPFSIDGHMFVDTNVTTYVDFKRPVQPGDRIKIKLDSRNAVDELVVTSTLADALAVSINGTRTGGVYFSDIQLQRGIIRSNGEQFPFSFQETVDLI